MKIVITGSQSTGKSTLAKMLSEKYDIPYIKELARNFTKEQLSQKNTKEYMKIQKQLLKMQIDAESRHESFISDRSTIDNLAYWLHNCSEIAQAFEHMNYKTTALCNIKKYDFIFLLKPEFYPVDDGFRDCDIVYQLRIDATINAILHLNNINHHKLTGPVEERFSKATEIIHKSDLK